MTSPASLGADGTAPGFVEWEHPSLDGTPLRGRVWSSPRPRGLLLISHGLGEHGGSYRRTAEWLVASLNIEVLAFDYRGGGRSFGKRGVVRDYSDLSLDLRAASRWGALERPDLPRFLLGHSNGGLVALRTVLDDDLGLSGLIVSNPPLEVSARVPVWKRWVGEVLLRVAPRITLETGVSNYELTHDPEVIAEIAADPLRHGRISPPLYFGMRATGSLVLGRGLEIKLPMLMILGGRDPITDPLASGRFFETLGSLDKTLKVYPEMRHEPLNEVGREAVLADLSSWLDPRLLPRD